MEAKIQQPWLSINCNAHLACRRCDVPNPLISDCLLISNRPRIYDHCVYMNPPPQEAYLYIFPARFHHPRKFAVVVVHIHPKTLIEIAVILSTNSCFFPSNSHVSATFSILLRFWEFWNPTNCEESNDAVNDGKDES